MRAFENDSYFHGSRFEKALIYRIDSRTTLHVKISSSWIDPGISQSAHCGQSSSFAIERRFGLARTESDKLEAELASELGVEKVAALKHNIVVGTGHTVTLEEEVSIRREFQLQSDRCGATRMKLFQKVFILDFLMQKKNLLGTLRETPFQLVELTQTFDCRVTKENFVASCGCKPDNPEPEAGFLRLFLGKLSVVLPYFKAKSGYNISMFDLDFDPDPRSFGGMVNARIGRASVPPVFAFLSDTEEKSSGDDDVQLDIELWSLSEATYLEGLAEQTTNPMASGRWLSLEGMVDHDPKDSSGARSFWEGVSQAILGAVTVQELQASRRNAETK